MMEILGRHASGSVAIVARGGDLIVSYGALVSEVNRVSELLLSSRQRPLIFLYGSNTLEAIVVYLAALAHELPICLLEPEQRNLERMVNVYEPHVVALPKGVQAPASYRFFADIGGGGYTIFTKVRNDPGMLAHPRLALMLQTSGSTGNPKVVRLRRESVIENAKSIAEYLGLSPHERSIQSLPMHYSYGLSLINSHLYAGGTIVLTPHSFMRPEFWSDFDACRCTSFAGVPYMYETLSRLKFEPAAHSSLKTLTQAGGALRPDLIAHFAGKAVQAGARLYVMYGQTEATARISYVPPETLSEKIGSIGVAIPGGHLSLECLTDVSDLQEIVYRGPNVMMGYGDDLSSLSHGDELCGTLHTADLGTIDKDGFFYVVGRLKRFAKLHGKRVNLADIEKEVESHFPVRCATIEENGKLATFVELIEDISLSAIKNHIAAFLNTPPASIVVRGVDEIPTTSSGKKNHQALVK